MLHRPQTFFIIPMPIYPSTCYPLRQLYLRLTFPQYFPQFKIYSALLSIPLHIHHTQTYSYCPQKIAIPPFCIISPPLTYPSIPLPHLQCGTSPYPHFAPACTPPVSPRTHPLTSLSRHSLAPPRFLPGDSHSENPSKPPPSNHPSPAPTPVSPRPLHHRAPPLALEALLRGGACPSSLFPPPPTVTLRGSLTPSGPAVTLAQRPVGGASQAPDPPHLPPPSRPVSSPWECAGWMTDLAARHRHRACRGRCRCLRKKPRLPPGGGAVASATAAAAARGRS